MPKSNYDFRLWFHFIQSTESVADNIDHPLATQSTIQLRLKNGAASRNRTEDPIITNDVLYQLS